MQDMLSQQKKRVRSVKCEGSPTNLSFWDAVASASIVLPLDRNDKIAALVPVLMTLHASGQSVVEQAKAASVRAVNVVCGIVAGKYVAQYWVQSMSSWHRDVNENCLDAVCINKS